MCGRRRRPTAFLRPSSLPTSWIPRSVRPTWATTAGVRSWRANGLLATFDGPARGVRCACAIRDAVRPLGLELRAGLHTGEIELAGEDVAGIAVHIGARVASLAGAGEVLVSSTVKDLVAGSGIQFEERGEHDLKGVPGRWRIYAVAP
ncbi:MAG: adenylate/guanylate cyclase domain-containing protein [Solirubrobacteraceae bacterium]